MEEEEEREPEGADSTLLEYLPRQARSTGGKPKYTYSDAGDDDDIDYEYSSLDNMSIEETLLFKPNDIMYPTAHGAQTVNCMLIRFLKKVSASVPRPSLTWTMKRVSFTTTFASGRRFTAETDGALWGPEERVPGGLRAKIYNRLEPACESSPDIDYWLPETVMNDISFLAEPGTKYRDYLTNPTSYGNGKGYYVKMQEYGPYDITIADVQILVENRNNIGPRCPPSFIFNGKECIHENRPRCPQNYVYDGKNCVSSDPPDCGSDAIFDGTNCVDIKPPRCPDGTSYDGHGCSGGQPPKCPEGMTFNGRDCIDGKPPQCPKDTTFNGEKCVSNDKPECPAGTTFDGSKCVNERPPECPENTSFNGHACVSITPPVCSDGTVFDGSKCVTKNPPVCPPGTRLENSMCVVTTDPICAEGTTFNGKMCTTATLAECYQMFVCPPFSPSKPRAG
ncbi:hypothetical protein BDV33DRAFT_204285 [Aspergillus novoparasiticus]|uniref:Uncharacterized protein n=1 Tax=Aspergillus novoparasiticus TaxID=986946 RepID=A0A5N6ERC8_9EURO|nr:hypothetical protein BDV33DRAFT_204285 [Aspergillus novoparasiticus]